MSPTSDESRPSGPPSPTVAPELPRPRPDRFSLMREAAKTYLTALLVLALVLLVLGLYFLRYRPMEFFYSLF